jgi:hypothetical protein
MFSVSTVLSDDLTELVYFLAGDFEVLLFFGTRRVPVPNEINEIGQDFDIVQNLGTQNLDLHLLVISKALHCV